MVTKDSVKRIRPGFGLEPKYYFEVMGKKLNIDVKRGTPVKIDFFDVDLVCEDNFFNGS